MEAIGLVVGVASLFSVCIDVVDRFEAYKNFGADSRQLSARFAACKLRLQKWASSVGIVDGELLEEHHIRLDEPEVAAVVKKILISVCEIFGKAEELERKLRLNPDQPGQPGTQSVVWPSLTSKTKKSDSMRPGKRNMGWMVKGKTQFTDQVSMLEALVSGLYDTVSPVKEDQPVKPLARASTEEFRQLADTQRALKLFMEEIRVKTIQQAHREVDDWLDIKNLGRQYEKYLDDRLEEMKDSKSEAHFLWINGPAGYGKSVICARLYQHFTDDPGFTCAYLSSTSHVQSGGQPDSIIRYWIAQMTRTNETVFDIVLKLVRSGQTSKTASDHQMWALMREVVSEVDDCMLVVDGFDEHSQVDDQRKRFLRKLKTAVAGTKTRCLVVSRGETDIESELNNAASEQEKFVMHECKVSEVNIKADVQLYSDHVVDTKLGNKEEGFRRQLAAQMVTKCEGMFLWIKLQQDQLRGGKSQKALQNIVQSMPKGLNQSYDRNWANIQHLSQDDHDRAMSILRWTTFAMRPLTVGEITEALIVDLDADSTEFQLDDLPDEVDDDYIDTEIKALCCALLEVRSADDTPPEARTIHVIHPSVKEYLISVLPVPMLYNPTNLPGSQQDQQHVYLANICLRYMNFEAVWKSERPFSKYAAFSWFSHIDKSGPFVESLNTDLNKFLRYDDENSSSRMNASLASWIKMYEDDAYQAVCGSSASHMYYAARFGLINTMKNLAGEFLVINEIGGPFGTALQAACYANKKVAVDLLLEWGADINSVKGPFQTALNAAVEQGHEEMSLHLIDKGAKVTIPNDSGDTALHFACETGKTGIAKALLQAGANANTRGNRDRTPLMWAAQNGHLDVSKLLLDRGATANVVDKDGWTPLHEAAYGGSLEVVAILLKSHDFDINAKDVDGWTPLHRSAYNGHLEVSKHLLAHGADVHAKTSEDWTPIAEAAYNGHLEVLTKFVVDHGADVNVKDINGWTPLHRAAYQGHLKVVHALVKDYGADVNAKTSEDWTPLAEATNNGHLEVATVLVRDYGVDINAQDINGWTPLHRAAYNGHPKVVQFLVDNGADTKLTTIEGWTPLAEAAYNGNLEIVTNLLVNYGADVNFQDINGWSPLHRAAYQGHPKVASFLVERGADIMSLTIEGWTTLHEAAYNGHLDVARYLIEKGAEVKAKDKHGWTPLHRAAYQGHLEMTRYLVDHGADIKAVTGEGWTALHEAVWNGHVEVAKFLLDLKMDVNAADINGWQPLQRAAYNGHLEATRLLLARGANIDSTTIEGWTSLHEAAYKGHLEVVKLLFEHGSNIKLANVTGCTALHFATEDNHIETAKFLIENGADVNAQDKDGFRPLHWAADHGHPKMAKYLLEHGVEKDAVNNGLWTALTLASHSGHPEVVEVLLAGGADFTKTSHRGWSALHYAANESQLAIAQMLVEKGIDISATSDSNVTPLHRAAFKGSADIVTFLLNKGAAINAEDVYKSTPLHEAIAQGHEECVRLLYKNGANLEAIDLYGRSCLDWLQVHRPYFDKVLGEMKEVAEYEDKTLNRMVENVRNISLKLLENDGVNMYPLFYVLGRCLLFLGMLDDARESLQYDLDEPDADGVVYHNASCDFCDNGNIKDVRYVCKTCVEKDMCESCFNSETKAKAHALCQDHEFFKVSMPEAPLTKEQWKERLAKWSKLENKANDCGGEFELVDVKTEDVEDKKTMMLVAA